MLADRFIRFFTSLRLTVVLLSFAIVLVFIGTIAQVDEGLYNAQARYFKQWFILGPVLFGKKLPIILPGGYLLGTMLVANLIAAHIHRFQLTTKKIGIQLAHGGVILLLVGQLATDMFSRETQMRFSEGEAKSYSDAPRSYELVFTTEAVTNQQMIVIPERTLARNEEVKNQNLPFAIRVKSYWQNSLPSFRAPMAQNAPARTTNGLAQHFDFEAAAEVKTMDDKNVPTALIEIIGPNGSLGDWIVSGWAGDEVMVEAVAINYARRAGTQTARTLVDRLTAPQTVSIGGKMFTFTLRPERIYHPFSLTLLKATHTTYPGRPDIPKDFRSTVRIENPGTQEKRETEIYMNSPLRYGGLTFYQYQMDAGEATRQIGRVPSSTLQVVRNPSWLTPYVGCALVAIGLTVQFMFHLVGFISKRKTK
jgi:hypothetical protein